MYKRQAEDLPYIIADVLRYDPVDTPVRILNYSLSLAQGMHPCLLYTSGEEFLVRGVQFLLREVVAQQFEPVHEGRAPAAGREGCLLYTSRCV